VSPDNSEADGRPGLAARDDPCYRALDTADHRRYWEAGANLTLSVDQHRVLSRWCSMAKGAMRTNDEIVRAVAVFVHAAMPRGDSEATESPPRPLGWIIDSGVGEAHGLMPPDTLDKPGWVCINTTALCSAMLRQLGYPVRECNVYLAQAGALETGFRGAVYQQAALQVWFDRAWHWVDPYFPAFDPAVTRDDRSRYKVDVPCYWAGTTTPTSWRPALPESDWMPFGLAESTGPDLQRRFYPKGDDTGDLETGIQDGAEARVLRLESEVDRRGGTVTSGVFVRTPTPGVRLSLRDECHRIVSRDRSEIPGGLHIERGAPIFGLDPRPGADRTTPVVIDGERLQHAETVFFGTRSLLATWEEVNVHQLLLAIEGPPGSRVDLHHDITIGDHVVTVNRLPASVVIGDGPQLVPFEVAIDPLDAAFHARFALLMKEEGVVTAGQYWTATDEIKAVREHARVSAHLAASRQQTSRVGS
jgi:hypothetical protein